MRKVIKRPKALQWELTDILDGNDFADDLFIMPHRRRDIKTS